MADETVHEVRVSLRRETPPIRKAHLEMTGTDVTFGVPGWQGEHYGFEPGTVEEHPGTLDYLVASVAGCLIGTFGGALKGRGIATDGDKLTAEAIGEVVVDPDDVLRLRRIIVRYHLQAESGQREAAQRACDKHAHFCPNARSVAAAIDIVTELDFIPTAAPEPAGV
jgi:organic hydroperoxide reductase OsmC/OhrA